MELRRPGPAPATISYTYFREQNFFEVRHKANPPRLSPIFSTKPVPYSQTSNPVYNTVRNEIRRIDNFGERNNAKGKKYKLNSRIHASGHYHKGNRDQVGFLYELFYFPSTSKSPRESFANLQMLIWWCRLTRVGVASLSCRVVPWPGPAAGFDYSVLLLPYDLQTNHGRVGISMTTNRASMERLQR